MSDVKIASRREADLVPFLEFNDYTVDEIGNNILRVSREDELPVFLSVFICSLYLEIVLFKIENFLKLYFVIYKLWDEGA